MTANPKKRPAASHTQGNVRKRPAGAARNPAAAAPALSEGADASGMRARAEGAQKYPSQYFATKAFRPLLSSIAAQEALQEGISVYVCVSSLFLHAIR